MFMKNLSFAVVFATFSVPAFAGSSYIAPDWDFRSGQGDTGSLSGNQIIGEVDNIDLNITAWSSSLHNNVSACKDSYNEDLCIQQAQLKRYSGGLGAINGDEGNNTPDHSVDNDDQDYDMILLSFSESVQLTSIYTGWNYTYYNGYASSQGTAGASVMAYVGGDSLGSTPFSSTDTWSSIIGPSGWTQIESDTKRTGTSGGLDTLPVSSADVYSKYWLVGAAHSVMRDAGRYTDHIKIAGIDFVKGTPPTSPGTAVNAPGALILFLGSVGWIVGRRKTK